MKKKNPLYVVNKKKKVVEPASSVIDYWIKKWGLGEAANLIAAYIKEVLKQLNSAPMIHAFLEFLQKKMNEVLKLLNSLNRFTSSKKTV